MFFPYLLLSLYFLLKTQIHFLYALTVLSKLSQFFLIKFEHFGKLITQGSIVNFL